MNTTQPSCRHHTAKLPTSQLSETYAGERERRGLRDLLRRFLGVMLRRRALTGLRDGLRLRLPRAGLRDTLLRRRTAGLLERSLRNT